MLVIGDAAHATMPNHGLGAAMATEYAYVQASLLTEVHHASELKAAFQAFEKVRLYRTQKVLLDEIALHPHNSGHNSIEACDMDQFEQHLHAIIGLPLGSCVPATLVVNVLGDATSSEDVSFSLLRNSLKVPGTAAHFYGTAGVRIGRQLGHMTTTAPSLKELTKRPTAFSPEAAKNSGLLKLQ
ncbi:hypothetical protein V7S43_005735 [Phytophthora oleae]|uniref:Phosphoribosylaminoimidazole carboxylase C-terminal domain-containing protein n=1 Tax=Phytophthora oleae TaxID=2107226 RepID=A0ABD3FSW0_9STRA